MTAHGQPGRPGNQQNWEASSRVSNQISMNACVGNASHKSLKSVICDQNVPGCVVDNVIGHINKNSKVGGAKLLGSKKPVEPISQSVTNDSNGDNGHKSIMSGVNATVSEQSDCIPLFDEKVSCGDNKFLNSLLTNTKKSPLCTKSVYFNSWRNQTDFDFVFSPISEFVMPAVVADRSHRSLSPIEMHNMVKASAQPNYLHCPSKHLKRFKIV